MRELSEEEEQWLEVFAKYNPFFDDLLRFFLKNNFLTEKQYEYLEKEIDRAEEDGDSILDKADFRFLKEHAEENEDLREILDIYEEDGFLDDSDFNIFIDIKLELNPDFQKREISTIKSKNKSEKYLLDINKKVCPHCSFLCPSQMKVCLKCGEPLSNVEDQSKQFTPDASQKKHDKYIPKDNIRKNLNLDKIREFLNEEILAKDPISNDLTYVLKLENNKWWIGRTKLILKTIEDFKRGKGNKWIINNPIISIEKLVFHTDPASLTLEYMKKYGWENVQGSSWYENQLDKYIPVKIQNYVNEQKKLKSQDGMKFEDFESLNDNIIQNFEESIYVLKLEKDKWYIGRSNDLESDLKKHKFGKKTSWTKLYKVKSVEEKELGESLRDVTIRYMKKYGWWNVRGYPFRGKGEKWPPEEIKEQFNSVNEEDSEKAVVYILRLENNKWYIGRTYNLARSLKFHKLGSPPWVDIHKFIDVAEIVEDGDQVEITLEYMRKYGWENVRGAHWRNWDLKKPPRVLREK